MDPNKSMLQSQQSLYAPRTFHDVGFEVIEDVALQAELQLYLLPWHRIVSSKYVDHG